MGLRHKTLAGRGGAVSPRVVPDHRRARICCATSSAGGSRRDRRSHAGAAARDQARRWPALVEREDLTADEMAGRGRADHGRRGDAGPGRGAADRPAHEGRDRRRGGGRGPGHAGAHAEGRRPAAAGAATPAGPAGDGSGSVNVTTAGVVHRRRRAGCKVAKHGNRALSSRAGSHDVIEALGIDPAPEPRSWPRRCLDEAGLCFMFAPAVPRGHQGGGGAPARDRLSHHVQPAGPADQPGRRPVPPQRGVRGGALRVPGPRPPGARVASGRWWCTARAAWTRSRPRGPTQVVELSADGSVAQLRDHARPTSACPRPTRRACAGARRPTTPASCASRWTGRPGRSGCRR